MTGGAARPSSSRCRNLSAEAAVEVASLRAKLRGAVGDATQLCALVRDIDRDGPLAASFVTLSEMYQLALRAFGPAPMSTAPAEYAEVCGKCLQAMQHSNPEEARLFQDFLAHQGVSLPATPFASSGIVLPFVAEARYSQGAPSVISCSDMQVDATSEQTMRSEAELRASEGRFSVLESDLPASEGRFSELEAEMPASEGRFSELDAEMPASEVRFSVLEEPTDVSSKAGYSEATAEEEEEESHTFSQGPDGPRPKSYVVNGVTYIRLRKIGKGGSAKVYEVQPLAAAEPAPRYALKHVTATSDAHLEAMENEISLLRQLRDCPQIMQLIDAEVLPDRSAINIVMELGEMDLGKLLQVQPNPSLADVQALWRQMLEAVRSIHERRIVHSDLKPANFMLTEGRLKLIDFGIAKRIACETTHIMRETPQGTISYMAPETILPGPDLTLKMGRPADIWSLGIMLYQVIYRHSPFAHLAPMQRAMALADPDLVISFPPEHSLEHHGEEVKSEVLAILRHCLQRSPALRPTLPELLAQPFAQRSARQVSRSSFERAIAAMVEEFHRAARDMGMVSEGGLPLGGEAAGEEVEEDGDLSQKQQCCQALSERVWGLLDSEAGVFSAGGPEVDAQAAASAMAPFREYVQRWLARGAKRQRMAQGGAGYPGVSAGDGRRLPPRTIGLSLEALAQQPPSAPPKTLPRVAAASAGQVPMTADVLALQRSCLRPAAAPGQAAGAAGKQVGGRAQDSVMMRRLKDRRARVVDPVDDELTSVTKWGVLGA